MKTINKMAVFVLCTTLAACSSGPFKQYSANDQGTAQSNVVGAGTKPGVAIGGSVGFNMDSFDRVKLSRALDKAPGKSTNWVNEISGVDYTVTPVKKLTVNGNPFCREYQAIAVKGGNKQETTGTACVATDGSWSEVRG